MVALPGMEAGEGLLIHVGMPKTASTWLQNHVFDDPQRGMTCPWGRRSGLAIDQFVIPTPFRFDAEAARRSFRDGLARSRERGLLPVLSEETLVGDPVSGRYWGLMVADRLQATFPRARIVLCIREQKAMILSAYKEYIKAGGTFSIERYLGAVERREGFSGVCQLDALEYDLIIDAYHARFGRDAVLTLVFEELQRDAAAFLGRLSDFLGLPRNAPPTNRAANVGHRGIGLNLRRIGNRYVSPADPLLGIHPPSWRALNRIVRAADRLLPGAMHAAVEERPIRVIREFVGAYFRESNRRTAALVGGEERLINFDL